MTLLPAEALLKPVEGHEDLFAFTFGFELEGKSMEEPVVTELEDGDLRIAGWAANFDGIDRQGENFADGAFQRGIKSFLAAGGPLCFHHKFDTGVGAVDVLDEVPGKGLWMEARVDKQEPTSPLYYIYNAVRKGSYKGLSVGGFFKRALTEAGRKIVDVDLAEISITPVSVHGKTNFSVVAGKALETSDVVVEQIGDDPATQQLEQLEALVNSLRGFTEGKALPRNHDGETAHQVALFLQSVGKTRSFSTYLKEVTAHPELGELADSVETEGAKWEAAAHKLAAKIGPLPDVSSMVG